MIFVVVGVDCVHTHHNKNYTVPAGDARKQTATFQSLCSPLNPKMITFAL